MGGRNKGSKKQKRKTKELIVGSDVEDSSSSEREETTTTTTTTTSSVEKSPAASKEQPPEATTKKVPEEEKKKEEEPKKEKPSSAPTDDEGPVKVERHEPITVTYCPICTFPAEMCEFSGMFEKCKPWLMENAKLLEAEAIAVAAEGAEKGRKQKVLGEKKVKGEQVLLFASKKRGSRNKQTTCVHGLDAFGHSLKDLSVMLKKKFQCGCTVTETPGLPDAVEVQGEVMNELVDMFQAEPYNVPLKAMYTLGKANARTCLAD